MFANRKNLYKFLILILNCLTIIMVILYGIHFQYTTSIPVLEFAWGCVGIALTIFVDTTQNRVLKLINDRPMALVLVSCLMLYMLVNIILSIF